MHINIPSSSYLGKESYTEYLLIPRGYTNDNYSQIKELPKTLLQRKHLKQDAVQSQAASEMRFEVKTDPAPLTPSDHLYNSFVPDLCGKGGMNFTSKRSLHNRQQIS